MNTPLENDGNRISRRKLRHLDVCTDPSIMIEDPRGSGFERLDFVHECLPECDADKVTTACKFLDYDCRLPILISCMTGGTRDGSPLNVMLARIAQTWKIPLGLGSMRILFHDETVLDDFCMRSHAPDVPILANIGAAQLGMLDAGRLIEMAKRIEVDALVVHLNPGQEIVQPGGDHNFSQVLDSISRLVDQGDFPIIVKETGHGIRPRRVRELLGAGVVWVDLAGAGGADWLQVEASRHRIEPVDDFSPLSISRDLVSWGLPTALILAALASSATKLAEIGPSLPGWLKARKPMPVIASGGIRTGLDLAKAIALGAGFVGIALPFVRAHAKGGEAAMERFVFETGETLKGAMFLTGSRTLDDLRRAALMAQPGFLSAVAQLVALDG